MPQADGRKPRALFLDRDGVMNVDIGYVSKREDFIWQDGIFELLQAARDHGLLPVVVTNQAGIARGYYTEDDFETLMHWVREECAARGTPLAKIYHCPYHVDAKIEAYRANHDGRKPKPGMLLAARDELGLDMAGSFMVGDQWKDAEAAAAAGVKRIAIIGAPEGAQPETLTVQRFQTLKGVKNWLRDELKIS